MKRRRSALLFCLAACGLAAYIYISRSGQIEVPYLDPSTPARQGGFEALQISPVNSVNNAAYCEEERLSYLERAHLIFKGKPAPATRLIQANMALVNGGPGGAGVWIQPPFQTQPAALIPVRMPTRATGRTSTGETLPLRWQMLTVSQVKGRIEGQEKKGAK